MIGNINGEYRSFHPRKICYAGVKKEDLPQILDSLGGEIADMRLDTIDIALKEVT